jgi:D-alanyl-D-alanine carboxypeptidase
MIKSNTIGVALLISLFCLASATPSQDLTAALKSLQNERQLKGMQVQVTKQKQIIFDINLGQKNEAGDPVSQNTLFRIASVSKSFSSVAIMQLVEQRKVALNQTLTSIFGYKI